MSCPSCSDLCVRYRIDSPSDLSRAIKIVSESVKDGTLREVDFPEQSNVPTFSQLAEGAGWNDVVSFAFKCQACAQSFALRAETYHGSGGYWEPT
jgi:hypothetical protein